MQFTGDYIDVELKIRKFAEMVANKPFAMASDHDTFKTLLDRRMRIFTQGIMPLIQRQDPSFLDNDDFTFLYRCADFREQVFFQYWLGRLRDEMQAKRPNRGRVERKDPAALRMNAYEASRRRNDGLVSVAAHPRLMGILKAQSPKLADELLAFAQENSTFPSPIKQTPQGFYDMRLAAYKDLGVPVDRQLELQAQIFSRVRTQAKAYAEKASAQLHTMLDKRLVRRQPSGGGHAEPDSGSP